jgi:acetoin utilization deacetylase AcuC-like enzyme
MTGHNVFYNADYVSSEYAFDTTRKSGALAAALKESSQATVVDPGQFMERTRELIDRLHSTEYVQAVRTGTPSDLAESQGFEWDPKLPSLALAHSAGLVAAVSEVLTSTVRVAGSLSSGLHHARQDRGAGYCTFNGLAVAATEALDRGAARVLVLDFDAHCGGGTRSMTSSDQVVQIDVSTVMFDSWQPSAAEDSLTHSGPDSYTDDIAVALRQASRAGLFDLVLYNAGMDPANSGVSTANLALR